jgi:hypothetical protein
MAEALIRFVQHVHGDAHEHDAVHEGGQDFEAIIAVRACRRGRSRSKANREQRQHQPYDVCEHVSRIGQ